MKVPIISSLVRGLSFILILLALITNHSCSKDDDFYKERRTNAAINFLDVLDAQAVGIASASAFKSGAKYQDRDVLIKVDEGGVVQVIRTWKVDTVYIETKDGTEMRIDSTEVTDLIAPKYLMRATADYLMVGFENFDDDSLSYGSSLDFLVSLETGKVFPLPYGFWPQQYIYGSFFNGQAPEALIQTDAQGYIYYVGKGDILKLDVSNPNVLRVDQLTTGGHTGNGVQYYTVNANGDILFDGGNPISTRFRFNNGGLAYPQGTIRPYWSGFDNEFYHSYNPGWQNGSPSYPVIEKIQVLGNQVSYQLVDSIVHPETFGVALDGGYFFSMPDFNKLFVLDLIDPQGLTGDAVVEIYNDDNKPKVFPMSDLGIDEVRFTGQSQDHYYLSGFLGNQPVLLKVDPSGFPHTAQNLLDVGAYDIQSLEVAPNNQVLLQAIRMSDGYNVIIQIEADGTWHELDSQGGAVWEILPL